MMVFLKPIENVLIRDPKSKEIFPQEGMLVELNTYWQRRINDGTLLIVNQKTEEKLIEKKVIMKGGTK
jgi:hypothetical protein